MKILHVIPGLSNASGPTQVVLKLAEKVVQAGHEADVIYLQGRGTDADLPAPAGVKLMGFPVSGLKYWGYSPAMATYLQQQVASYDLLHLHSLWLYPNWVASRAAVQAGVPYLVRPAGSLEPWCMQESGWLKRTYLRLIERRVLDQAAKIHAVSRQEAQNIEPYGFQTSVLEVPNGIELDDFRSTGDPAAGRARWEIPAEARVILFLSRIHPKKNLGFLGRVFRALLEADENYFLVVAGPDSNTYAQEMKRYYAELGIAERCRFTGEVKGAEKSRVYQLADLFVLPTHSENFGVVVLEALAAGLPAVVSTNAPWAELEAYQAGRWLDLEEEAFVQAIQEIMQTPEKYADRARKLATTYSWEQVSVRLLTAYQDIIDQAKANN